MNVHTASVPRGVHRRLLITLLACPGIFAVTFLYALTGYPSWMWWAVMGGLVLPFPVALVIIVMLAWHLRGLPGLAYTMRTRQDATARETRT